MPVGVQISSSAPNDKRETSQDIFVWRQMSYGKPELKLTYCLPQTNHYASGRSSMSYDIELF